MGDLIREKYQLSVWEKKPSKADKFIMIIGSDSMVSPYRATAPHLKTKVNGEKILTFTLYSRYFDSEIGEFVDNPFINYLHNEVLVKLHRGTEPTEGWEEFIIKDIQEDSQAKSFTYTAKGAQALELGKSGYSLTFSQELMNNTGTVTQLGEQVVKGTDWKINVDGSDKLWGAKSEPLYELKIVNIDQSKVNCIRTAAVGSLEIYHNTVSPSVTKPENGAIIYVPYSSYENFIETNEINEIQFLWNPDGIYEVDNEGVIYTANSYVWSDISTDDITGTGQSEAVEIDLTKKGDLLQNQNKTIYLKGIDKVVTEGKIEDEDAYHFVETDYLTSDTVQELIVNGNTFEDTNGWRNIESDTSIYLNFKENSLDTITSENFASKLVLKNNTTAAKCFLNAAIRSNISILSNSFGIKSGESFVIKSNFSSKRNEKIRFILAKYTTSQINGKTVVEIAKKEDGSEDTVINKLLDPGQNEYSVTALKTISHTELSSEGYGLFIRIAGSDTVELSSLSFYKKVLSTDGETSLNPESIPESRVINTDFYLLKKDYNETQTLEETHFYNFESGEIFIPNFQGTDYEKVTSINISKSNRFNIIQELCEAFNCWAKFNITHDANGNITEKTITFKKFVGDNKDIGFSYGLNLKGVKRNLVSDQIVTKLIVEQNNNELAENGFCTIVRAKDNKPKTNFIYDFSYYINQNILLESDIKKDFYGDGLLRQIGTENKLLLKYNEELIALEKSQFTYEKNIAAAREIKDAALAEQERLRNQFRDYTNMEYDVGKVTSSDFGYKDDDKVKEIVFCITIQDNLVKSYEKTLTTNESALTAVNEKITAKKQSIKSKSTEVNSLITQFENKYASFIQEGTWIDEGYYDDNLYFYDANIVLHTSAFPKVNYTIDVIDLSPLGDEYTPFKFKIGDKTYIEDTEFFGWNQANANPYREEVVISEIDEYFEAPEQNKITVQNYKTQFEDLFQRVAATTQSLQYSAGAYQKAANKITDNNEFDFSTLQNSLLAGALNLQNMGNMSISWTEEGFIVSSQDSSQAHKKLRLSNTGLDLSVDGGQTWRTAITGTGITADEITTGSLNANKISIKSGKASTFIWDVKGLRAYETNWIGDQVSSVNYNTYIEFNDKGLIAYKQNLQDPSNPLTPFKLTSDGNLTLTGIINAQEGGSIGGWEIGQTSLYSGGVGLSSDSSNSNNLAVWAGLGAGVITPIFYVTYGGFLHAEQADITGTITANKGYIGNWALIDGSLSSTNDETDQGIILDATNSQIYSKEYKSSNGGAGWSITNNEAIFNNITLRGALKCAVLEYGEVQAVGGIMMIRPSTTIKERVDKENADYLILEVENATLFRPGDFCKIASDIDQFENIDGSGVIENVTLNTGINTNLFQLIKIENNRLFFDIDEVDSDYFPSDEKLVGMGIISLGKPGEDGQDGSIGLGLNSSENRAMLPQTSFSVFSLEKPKNRNWYYLKPHIILGKIPEDAIYGIVAGKYGLYADAAEITGAIHATTLTLGDSGKNIVSNGRIAADYLDTQDIEESINSQINSTKEQIAALKDQIGGTISTWSGEGNPNDLQKYPWPEEDNPDSHVGDLYYDKSSGKSYRFFKENGEYEWVLVQDTEVEQALQRITELEENYESISSSVSGLNSTIINLNEDYIQLNRPYEGTTTSVMVSKEGLLTANNAVITGTIFATTGEIGNWVIAGGALYDSGASIWLSPTGATAIINNTERASIVFKAGSKFGVSKSGTLYATGVNVAGTITATAGTIGSWDITTAGIYNSAMSMNPNILKGSDEKITNNKHLIATYDVSKELESGKQYTVSICLERPQDVKEYWIYLSSGYKSQKKFIIEDLINSGLKPDNKGRYILEGTFTASYATGKTPTDDPAHAQIRLYCDKDTGGDNSIIYWIKIEEGEKRTEYTAFTEAKARGELVGFTQYDMWNGSALNGYSSALWLGGKSSTAPFRVTKEGKLYATGANISGTITATAGKIGNLTLSNGKLFKLTSSKAGGYWSAGINSSYNTATGNYNTIFLWSGAKDETRTLQELQTIFEQADYVEAQEIIKNSANFYVTHDGILHAKDAVITGNITLENGSINWSTVNSPSIDNISNLTTQLNTISGKADKAQNTAENAQNSIDDLSIGGKNLIRASKNPSKDANGKNPYWTGNYTINTSVAFNENAFVIIDNTLASDSYTGKRARTAGYIRVDPGEWYTVSMLVYRYSKVSSMDILFRSRSEDSENTYDISQGKTKLTPTIGKWVKVTWSFQMHSNAYEGYLCVNNNGSTTQGENAQLWFTNVKFEKGNRATDWTAAPEDLEAETDQKIEDASNTLTTAYQNYAKSQVSALDTAVSKYLGFGGSTLINGSGIISPYIGGGYLNITKNSNQVVIDPGNDTNTGYCFMVKRGTAIKLGIDISGNATFAGTVQATAGEIGDWNILDGYLYYGGTIGTSGSLFLIPKGSTGKLTISTSGSIAGWCITVGNTFGITKDGEVYAAKGGIGKLVLSNSKLFRLTNLNNPDSSYKYYCSGLNTNYSSSSNDTIFLWAAAKIAKTSEYADEQKAKELFGASNWLNAKNLITETASFYVTQTGKMVATNAEITGKITASSGEIGNWNIGTNSLYYLPTGTTKVGQAKTLYLCPGGTSNSASIGGSENQSGWAITVGETFGITTGGKLYATGGKIAGWDITSERIESQLKDSNARIYIGSASYTTSDFWIAARDEENNRTFSISKKGQLTATKANITGTITATAGHIGGWTITSNRIYSLAEGSSAALYLNSPNHTSLYWISALNTSGTRTFSVSKTGQLYATGVELQGSIISHQSTTFKGYNSIYSNLSSNATVSFGGKTTGGTERELAYIGLTGTNNEGIHSLAISNNNNTKRYEILLNDNDFAHRFLGNVGIGNKAATGSFPISLMIINGYGTVVGDQGYFGNMISSYNLEGSDERLKKDILPLGSFAKSYSLRKENINEDISEKLFDSLIPVSYKRIDEENRISYGLIAQQILEALNQCGLSEQDSDLVHETTFRTGEKYYAVNYTNFIGLLIHEVQKLKKRINELEQNQN